MTLKSIPLSELVEDFAFYPRTMVSAQHVATLIDAISMGQKLPPIVVDSKSKRIVDGFHRYRAHKRRKIESASCDVRSYKSDAEMFADAVRLNSAHGRPMVPFERKRAIERLRRYGFDEARIIEVVRITPERIVELVSRFSTSESGEERAVKASHESMLAGETMTKRQEQADARRDGMNATYHARQLIIALQSGLWQRTPAFEEAMEKLSGLWEKVRSKKTV